MSQQRGSFCENQEFTLEERTEAFVVEEKTEAPDVDPWAFLTVLSNRGHLHLKVFDRDHRRRSSREAVQRVNGHLVLLEEVLAFETKKPASEEVIPT